MDDPRVLIDVLGPIEVLWAGNGSRSPWMFCLLAFYSILFFMPLPQLNGLFLVLLAICLCPWYQPHSLDI